MSEMNETERLIDALIVACNGSKRFADLHRADLLTHIAEKDERIAMLDHALKQSIEAMGDACKDLAAQAARIAELEPDAERCGRQKIVANPEFERLVDELNEVEQVLGKVLHYPWFKDDQKNFPGATEADGVCVGEHVASTIAAEAAQEIIDLRDQVEWLKQ